MDWQKQVIKDNQHLMTDRFKILFHQVLRLREKQFKKLNNKKYQSKINKLIEGKIEELKVESERIGITWYYILLELEEQGF